MKMNHMNWRQIQAIIFFILIAGAFYVESANVKSKSKLKLSKKYRGKNGIGAKDPQHLSHPPSARLRNSVLFGEGRGATILKPSRAHVFKSLAQQHEARRHGRRRGGLGRLAKRSVPDQFQILKPHNATAEFPDDDNQKVDKARKSPKLPFDTNLLLKTGIQIDSGDSESSDELQQQQQSQVSDEPIIFTIANTDTGRRWGILPYREKFQWNVPEAPCHQFDLIVPDEREGHGLLTLCIYRQRLHNPGGSGLIIHEEDKHVDLFEQREVKVYGQVQDAPGSAVYGRLVETYFYGEISLVDPSSGEYQIFVVEEVKLLSKLFHQSRRLFHNIVEVVSGGTTTSAKTEAKYNAVITKGSSLLSFMTINSNTNQLVPLPVVVLTTEHNSYITPGQPTVVIDEKGQMNFVSPGKITLSLELDGSILLTTKNRVYTFRPNGTSMMKEGVSVTPLQQTEGSLAVTAVSDTLTYGCVLPSHSFSRSRKGGYLCKVCLAADRQFQEQYLQLIEKNDTTIISFLSDVIDQVSWIYRSVDWNDDGIPDNIGLDYDTQFSEWSYDDDGSEIISEEALDVLFESLSTLDFSDCCLGVAYTMKKFPHDIYAKAPSSTPTEPGGICTLRKDGISKNVVLISAQSKSTEPLKPLTSAQLTYLTAHEIGKTFGANIDTSGLTGCDSFEEASTKLMRHYLLWPDVFRPNITLQEKSFSKCSKKAIVETLDSCRSSCFEVDLHPFCGNGIQEEGEECDCGSEESCANQECCYGRTGKFPCRKTGFDCEKNGAGMGKMDSKFAIIFVLLCYLLLSLLG